jgi:transcriptional regulator with PAS, ATPase and Fis domain
MDVFDAFPFLPERSRDEYHRVLKTGRSLTTEEKISLDKKEIITETQKIPILDNGKVNRIITIVRDITNERSGEILLKEVKQRQDAILNNIPDMAWLKDKDRRFIAVNESFAAAPGSRRKIWSEDRIRMSGTGSWQINTGLDDKEVMSTGRRKVFDEPLIDSKGNSTIIETIKTLSATTKAR